MLALRAGNNRYRRATFSLTRRRSRRIRLSASCGEITLAPVLSGIMRGGYAEWRHDRGGAIALHDIKAKLTHHAVRECGRLPPRYS